METTEHAVTHSPDGEGKTVWMVGTDLITFKATGEDTEGAFALFDSLVLPGGGPPPHIHHRESESFYVLEGRFEFLAENGWIKAAPGSFVHVPKGTLHTLKNAGEGVGRLLTLAMPAGLDRFFEEAGEPGTDVSTPPGPPDVEKLLATAERYGIEFPPPPAQ
ncbi:MAG TPA: cupin domain-containing protein [Rubrobacteraceae bacterium]|nr:cupin domain-containing protein [Rubrobacteraceae bacterium]